MCDVAKLRGKIAERGLSQIMLARATGMNKSTLSRKMRRGEAFTIGEASKIASILNLTKDEAVAIFFTNIVA